MQHDTEEIYMILWVIQKWHPDKHKGDSAVTAKFQEINEAYRGNSYGYK